MALIVDERRQALGDLAVLRVEELPEHGGDRLLLTNDMGLELPVDVVDEGLADVLEARLWACVYALASARSHTVQALVASW